MRASKTWLDKLAGARFGQLWFLAASFAVNLPVFWFLASAMRTSPGADTVIPVTLVAPPEQSSPEPEPEPEPEPAAPPERDLQSPATPAPASSREPAATRQPAPAETPDPPVQPVIETPVIAAPDEAPDEGAVLSAPAPETSSMPDLALPSMPGSNEKATAALQAFNCNRLGKPRPAYCDEAGPSAEAAAEVAALAESDEIEPKAWATFKVEVPDLALERLKAEKCPPRGGVIDNVFRPSSNPFQQGAGGMSGTLSHGAGEGILCD